MEGRGLAQGYWGQLEACGSGKTTEVFKKLHDYAGMHDSRYFDVQPNPLIVMDFALTIRLQLLDHPIVA